MTTKDKNSLLATLRSMRYRCSNPKHRYYKYYGAKGIKVCNEWRHDYRSFLLWAVKTGYRPGMTIDRIDGNKDYSPDNCRWVSRKEQANNRCSNETVEYNGTTLTISQLAEISGIPYGTALMRHRRGWSPERIASQKLRSYTITDDQRFAKNRKAVTSRKWKSGDYAKRKLPQNRT